MDRNDAKYYAETLRKKAEALEKALNTERKSNRARLQSKDDEIAELRRRIEQLESRQ